VVEGILERSTQGVPGGKNIGRCVLIDSPRGGVKSITKKDRQIAEEVVVAGKSNRCNHGERGKGTHQTLAFLRTGTGVLRESGVGSRPCRKRGVR